MLERLDVKIPRFLVFERGVAEPRADKDAGRQWERHISLGHQWRWMKPTDQLSSQFENGILDRNLGVLRGTAPWIEQPARGADLRPEAIALHRSRVCCGDEQE